MFLLRDGVIAGYALEAGVVDDLVAPLLGTALDHEALGRLPEDVLVQVTAAVTRVKACRLEPRHLVDPIVVVLHARVGPPARLHTAAIAMADVADVVDTVEGHLDGNPLHVILGDIVMQVDRHAVAVVDLPDGVADNGATLAVPEVWAVPGVLHKRVLHAAGHP